MRTHEKRLETSKKNGAHSNTNEQAVASAHDSDSQKTKSLFYRMNAGETAQPRKRHLDESL